MAKTSKGDDTFTPEVYYIKQHLGSTELTMDNSAQVINAFNYEPFGDVEAQFGQSDKTVYRFTDKEQDKESGLGYFSQRYMNHSYGQFITPDPVFAREPRFTDPQRWSPYAYGRGNPLRYSDPTGEFIGDVMNGRYDLGTVGYHEAISNMESIADQAHADTLSDMRSASNTINEVAATVVIVGIAAPVIISSAPVLEVVAVVTVTAEVIAASSGAVETYIDAIDGDEFDAVDATNNLLGVGATATTHAVKNSGELTEFGHWTTDVVSNTFSVSSWGSQQAAKLDNNNSKINQSTDGKKNGSDGGTNHRSSDRPDNDGESTGGANSGAEQSSNTKLD
ncbi:RHS repeat-associated core domain-containing protein [Vibrio kanaloae]|uniref:RHS repeat-associated core domain-containing protein n=1 Tax=Vibrio kanaloae TaxID=170673 RepID=UPI001FCBB292|nr:RHS repeat-associated core domain-containing protein [Vibrio kanaloae]